MKALCSVKSPCQEVKLWQLCSKLRQAQISIFSGRGRFCLISFPFFGPNVLFSIADSSLLLGYDKAGEQLVKFCSEDQFMYDYYNKNGLPWGMIKLGIILLMTNFVFLVTVLC